MTNCRFESSNYYLLFHIFISRFGSSSLHDFTSPLCFDIFIIRITICCFILSLFTSIFELRFVLLHYVSRLLTSTSPSPPSTPAWKDFFYRLLDNNFNLIGQWVYTRNTHAITRGFPCACLINTLFINKNRFYI